jgi:hypothetical protein
MTAAAASRACSQLSTTIRAPTRRCLGDTVGYRGTGLRRDAQPDATASGGARISDRRQLIEPHRGSRDRFPRPGREPGLSDSAHSRQRDQPMGTNLPAQFFDLDISALKLVVCAAGCPAPSNVRRANSTGNPSPHGRGARHPTGHSRCSPSARSTPDTAAVDAATGSWPVAGGITPPSGSTPGRVVLAATFARRWQSHAPGSPSVCCAACGVDKRASRARRTPVTGVLEQPPP